MSRKSISSKVSQDVVNIQPIKAWHEQSVANIQPVKVKRRYVKMVRSLTLCTSKTVHFLTLCLLTFSIETMKTTILQSLIKIVWDPFYVNFAPGPL